MNAPDNPQVEELVRQAILTKMLVVAWQGIAKAQSAQEKLTQFLSLVIITVTGGQAGDQAHAVMALIANHKNKVFATSDEDITALDDRLAASQSGDVIKDEGFSGVVSRIKLSNKKYLLIASAKELDEGMSASLSKDFHTLQLESDKNIGKLVLTGLLTMITIISLFIPLTDWVSATAIAEGEKTSVITAPISGEINWLIPTGSIVNQGDVIVRFGADDIESELNKINIQIRALELNISAQGALPTENVGSLDEQKNSAEIEKQRLELLLARSVAKATQTGVLEWRDLRVGTYVQRGKPLGEMTKLEQSLVIARINVRDWIKLPKSANAIFVTKDGTRINAVVEQQPYSISSGEGEPYYRTGLRLEKPVTAGEVGLIKINGYEKPLGLILFKRPVQWLRAHTALRWSKE